MIAILLGLLGGIIYRMRGGWPDIPRPIEQCLFCIPIVIVSLSSPWWITALAYIISVVATLMGHGHSMSYHSPTNLTKIEKYEKYSGLYLLIGKIPDYWYKFIAHSFGGLLVTLPLLLTNPALCWVGALKGPAYAIGWGVKLPEIKINKFTIKEETEWGEFLTGLFVWSTLLWMLI